MLYCQVDEVELKISTYNLYAFLHRIKSGDLQRSFNSEPNSLAVNGLEGALVCSPEGHHEPDDHLP